MVSLKLVYGRLRRLVPDVADLEPGHARVSRRGSYQDLHLDVLERGEEKGEPFVRIALAHYREMNGDQVSDPDMGVRVWPGLGMAEAMHFQNALVYREVYPEPGKVNLREKQGQNEFLAMWLNNAWHQGHRLGPETRRSD